MDNILRHFLSTFEALEYFQAEYKTGIYNFNFSDYFQDCKQISNGYPIIRYVPKRHTLKSRNSAIFLNLSMILTLIAIVPAIVSDMEVCSGIAVH